LAAGCDKHDAKKADPTKGVVTGIVLCADTGKPARFATVTLSAAPRNDEEGKEEGKEGEPLPATESTVTDLDGRFRIEAVEPRRYYAFATLEGYLDPMRGMDFSRLEGLAGEKERNLEAISQWKDYLVEARVHVNRVSEISLQIERGAEIGGTVSYDDGSPAIGMHFQLFRKGEKSGLSEVGLALLDGWSTHAVSDSHGHFSLTNLSAGEYAVCALMPSDSENASTRICLGNTFRKKDAKTVKVKPGEIAGGMDIVVPLTGMHTVAGYVTDLANGHALNSATVRLLYGDDREKIRETSPREDGSFSFSYIPEGRYIVQVTEAIDTTASAPQPTPDAQVTGSNVNAMRRYKDKELPLVVMSDVSDIQLALVAITSEQQPNTLK
jgi:hypothetical protein